MDQGKITESTPASKPHPDKRTKSKDPWSIPLSTLVDTYPHDVVLQYVIVPTALHAWWTLLGIVALVFSHYRVCREFWSTERVCSSRTHYLLFAVECVLVALMGYTYYLKNSMRQRTSGSSGEHK